MESNIIMKFKTRLENERDLIAEKIRTKGNGVIRTSAEKQPDEADVASSEVDTGMSLRMGNRETLYLKKIEQALERIRSKEYGECTNCGADIGERRLEARPTAEFCINCKEELEQNENASASGRKHKSVGSAILLRDVRSN